MQEVRTLPGHPQPLPSCNPTPHNPHINLKGRHILKNTMQGARTLPGQRKPHMGDDYEEDMIGDIMSDELGDAPHQRAPGAKGATPPRQGGQAGQGAGYAQQPQYTPQQQAQIAAMQAQQRAAAQQQAMMYHTAQQAGGAHATGGAR